MQNNLMLLIMMVVMIFLLFILPARRQKQYREQLMNRQNQMTPGTRVKTNWGLHGTVSFFDRERGLVGLEIARDTVVEIDSQFVTELVEVTAPLAEEN